MRSLLALAAACYALSGSSLAITGEAIALRDGPSGGRFIGPIWIMSCPAGQKMVGVRIHEDKRIAGIEAICTKTSAPDDAPKWIDDPRIAAQPKVRRHRSEVAYVDDEGQVLSAAGDEPGELRDGSAQRVVIVEESDWVGEDDGLEESPVGYDTPGADAELAATEAVYRPADAASEEPEIQAENSFETAYARSTWANTPYLWRFDGAVYRGAVVFKKVRGSYDLSCARDSYVTGIQTGWRSGAGTDRFAGLQLVCGTPGGREHTVIGELPAKPKKAKSPIRVQRAECEGSASNPLDGHAVQAIFGTIEGGRVQTIGVSCTPWAGR